MEGNERANVEARIKCLRNIQVLLDAAVMEMQQYSSVVSQLEMSSRRSSSVEASAASARTDNVTTTTEAVAKPVATAETGARAKTKAKPVDSSAASQEAHGDSSKNEEIGRAHV